MLDVTCPNIWTYRNNAEARLSRVADQVVHESGGCTGASERIGSLGVVDADQSRPTACERKLCESIDTIDSGDETAMAAVFFFL